MACPGAMWVVMCCALRLPTSLTPSSPCSLKTLFLLSLLTMPMKKDPRDKEGTIVHALVKLALGEHTAKNIFGNVDYNKTFIQGTVMNVFDGCKPNGKNAVWVLRVDFMLPSDDPMAIVKLKRAEIQPTLHPRASSGWQESFQLPAASLPPRHTSRLWRRR